MKISKVLIEQNQIEQKKEQVSETSLQNISIENATFLENMENTSNGLHSESKLDGEPPNFEVDSIELATPQLFSDDKKVEAPADKNEEEPEIGIFESSENEENSEIKEPEMFEKNDSEEDFEIPAFLRRQKN